MALYVDSAYLDDIVRVAQIVPLAGITTNPTILLAAKERGQRMPLEELVNRLLVSVSATNGTVFIQPGSMNEEEMYQHVLTCHWQVTRLGYSTARLMHKLPMTPVGMSVARRLKQTQMKHRIAFTAVTTVAQAYTAAMIGAEFVIPYYNRLLRTGVDANERIAQMAELIHKQKLPTRILAASVKSPQEATSVLLAGVHDITAPPDVLLDMVHDPQTEEAIEKFVQDWLKMNKL